MSPFAAMNAGRTGVGFARYWLDTVAHNIANLNTVTSTEDEPYRARKVIARPWEAASGNLGVYTAAVAEAGGEAPRVYDPAHPLAGEDGDVIHPVVDLGGEMTDLIIANRTYQANLKTVETAREAYQSALRLGR